MKANVIVEVRDAEWDEEAFTEAMSIGFEPAPHSERIPMRKTKTTLIPGTVPSEHIKKLEKIRGVVRVWDNPQLATFGPVRK